MKWNKKYNIHVLLWSIYWGIEYLLMYLTTNNLYPWESIPNSIINTIQFYVIIKYILPSDHQKIIFKKHFTRLLLLFVVVILLKLFLLLFIEKFDLPYLHSIENIKLFLIANSYRFIIFTIYAGFIWFYTTRNKLSKILLEKELQEEKLKNTLLLAQQSVLITKINPHFLFNTLSFLYSKSITSSDEVVSKTILLLSDVFRYSLKNSNENQLVRINDELDHIKRLIEINKLRFNNKFYFNITNIGEEKNKQFPPFILLTLFENALKHGDFQNPNAPISFCIEQLSDKIIIRTSNKKKKNVINEMESNNIGLKYIGNVLESFYRKNCTLHIENLAESYMLQLTIITND